MISLIAAVASNGAIGNKGSLLWHLAADLKYFKARTMGHPVIMGRKTFESIGRALPGRRNIVVSASGLKLNSPPQLKSDGTPWQTSLQQVKDLKSFLSFVRTSDSSSQEYFVIGGGSVYRQAMPFAASLYITHIQAVPEEADAFFPQIAEDEWDLEEKSEVLHDAENGIDFYFATYRRKLL